MAFSDPVAENEADSPSLSKVLEHNIHTIALSPPQDLTHEKPARARRRYHHRILRTDDICLRAYFVVWSLDFAQHGAFWIAAV